MTLEDQGEGIVPEPAADDPIAVADGALAEQFAGLDLRQLRKAAREDEETAEGRRPLRGMPIAREQGIDTLALPEQG